MAKIFIVEDDLHVAKAAVDLLGAARHIVEHCADGDDARQMLKVYEYDLIILDWQLPGTSGVEICREYRHRGGTAPILMLTGKSLIDDKETGFQSGADDYLTKPFDPRELIIRVNALLCRPRDYKPPVLKCRDMVLDPNSSCMIRGGTEIALHAKEFAVIEFLMKRPGVYFLPEALLNRIWGSDSDATIEALRTVMKKLRHKLEVEGEEPLIVSVRGLGYKLNDKG